MLDRKGRKGDRKEGKEHADGSMLRGSLAPSQVRLAVQNRKKVQLTATEHPSADTGLGGPESMADSPAGAGDEEERLLHDDPAPGAN